MYKHKALTEQERGTSLKSVKKSNNAQAPKTTIKKAQEPETPNTEKVQVPKPRRSSVKKTQESGSGENDSLSDLAKGRIAKRLADMKEENSKTDTKLTTRSSTHQKGGTESKPDWYEELSEEQITMFRELFELLDRDGGGSIDGDELFEVMKDLDIGVTKDDIVAVLRDLDKDGNDEIDFDDFLFCMSCPERWMKEVPGESKEGTTGDEYGRKYSNRRRGNIFFTAITNFAIKNSMGAIEKFCAAKVRRVPHVIGHYTAGARLIGLTDRQIERHLAHIRMSSKDSKSPYAKPFVLPASSKKSSKHTGGKTAKGQLDPKTAKSPLRRDRQQTVNMPSSEFCDSAEDMVLYTQQYDLADKGNTSAKLPDDPHGQKLASGEIDASHPKSAAKEGHENRNCQARPRSSVHGTREVLPLPHIKLSVKGTPTVDDLHQIRKEVSSVVNDYYSKLRRRTVRTAWVHWGELHADQIHSRTLQANFWRSFKAYSPRKEEHAFVICPWIPNPVKLGGRGGRYGRNSATPTLKATTPRPVSV